MCVLQGSIKLQLTLKIQPPLKSNFVKQTMNRKPIYTFLNSSSSLIELKLGTSAIAAMLRFKQYSTLATVTKSLQKLDKLDLIIK